MTASRWKRIGVIAAVIVLAAVTLGGAGWMLSRFFPRHDPTPIIVARKDERTAAAASTAIAAQTAAANRDTTIHLDLTTKEIRDAFDAPQPDRPAVPADPAGLPPAPVDRLRDRLNESIARANRAADAAGGPD